MTSMKANTIIYLYNMGVDKSIKKEIDSNIEDFIYNSVSKYLGNREEIEIEEDPYQLKGAILNWFRQSKIDERQVNPLCKKLRDALSTRSVEAQRNLILYLRAHKKGEPFLYIIHTSERLEVVDEDFKKIIEVGLGPGKILRVLQFSRLSIDSVQLSYREKSKSNLLINLFHITSNRYKSTGSIKLKGSFGTDLDFIIELTPSNFLKHYNINNIKFEEDDQIVIFDRYSLKLREIKVGSNYIKPTKSKIEKFIKTIKDEFDEHEELIEKFLLDFQSIKLKYGIEQNMSLTKFLHPNEFPDRESIKFEEGREFVRCFINDKLDCSIKKPLDPWGEFFVIDNLINFSQHYIKDIAREIIIGSLRNVRFIEIPYSKEKLKIGQYYWHNDFLIHSNLKKLLEFLQDEYGKSDSDKKRRLLLVAMLDILKNAVDNICVRKFSKEIIFWLIKGKENLSRDIVEDNIFEFKKGDILDASTFTLPQRIKKISNGLRPNLNNSGISILIVGYDEDRNQITPIKFNHYREEVRQEIYDGIKDELSNQELIINIFLINTEDTNEGLIIIFAADKKFSVKIDLNNLFS